MNESHSATLCNTLQRLAAQSNTATNCNALLASINPPIHCITLQHTTRRCNNPLVSTNPCFDKPEATTSAPNSYITQHHTWPHLSTLKPPATPCNTVSHCITLQHTVRRCNTQQDCRLTCRSSRHTDMSLIKAHPSGGHTGNATHTPHKRALYSFYKRVSYSESRTKSLGVSQKSQVLGVSYSHKRDLF